VFCIVEPKRGRHDTHATKNRTMPQFAGRCNASPQVILMPAPFIW
jgi:hypothetical protein